MVMMEVRRTTVTVHSLLLFFFSFVLLAMVAVRREAQEIIHIQIQFRSSPVFFQEVLLGPLGRLLCCRHGSRRGGFRTRWLLGRGSREDPDLGMSAGLLLLVCGG